MAASQMKPFHALPLLQVLTNDSDFYVHGLSRIIHVDDIVFDRSSTTFHVWNTSEAWKHLHQRFTGCGSGGAMVPSLTCRAHLAAVLGNDISKDVRARIQQRSAQEKLKHLAYGQLSISIKHAAQMILLNRASGYSSSSSVGKRWLGLDFFHSEPVSLRGFTAEDLDNFYLVVDGYLEDDKACRDGDGVQRLTLSSGSLPWLPPRMVSLLPALPWIVVEWACRGLGTQMIPEPEWSRLQDLRRELARRLGAPGPVYEYDPNSFSLHQLTVPGDTSVPDWFCPDNVLKQLGPGLRMLDRTQAHYDGTAARIMQVGVQSMLRGIQLCCRQSCLFQRTNLCVMI